MGKIAGKFVTRLAIACSVVLLWFGPYLSGFMTDKNRYYIMWEHADAWILLAPVLGYALVLAALSLSIDRMGSVVLTRLFHCAFLLGFGGAVLTNITYQLAKLRPYHWDFLDVLTHGAWVALALLAGYCFAQRRSRWIAGARMAALVISPSVFVLIGQLVSGAVFPPRFDELPTDSKPTAIQPAIASSPQRPTPSVYLFVFDEWSYDRTYQNGRLREGFEHLARFSEQAIVVHDAISPATCTELSMPALLRQTSLPATYQDGRVGFTRDDTFVPADQLESIYAAAGEERYFKAFVGFALPFGCWLGSSVELCRAYPFYDIPNTLSHSFQQNSLAMMRSSADPLMQFIYNKWNRSAPFTDFYRQLHVNLRQDVTWMLTRAPSPTFAVMHYNLPHKPYIHGPQGQPRGDRDEIYAETVENYQRHLAYLDQTIGHFVSLLVEAGRYDDAVVIMTSDHSWRADPKRHTGEHSPRHVPLVIKLPHQQTGVQVHEPFETYRIGALIRRVLEQQPAHPAELITRSAKSDSDGRTLAGL